MLVSLENVRPLTPAEQEDFLRMNRVLDARKLEVCKGTVSGSLPDREQIQAGGDQNACFDELFNSWFQDEPRTPVQKSAAELQQDPDSIFDRCMPFNL